jgi:hypothetical protein
MATILAAMLVSHTAVTLALCDSSTSFQEVAKTHGAVTVLSFKEFFESGDGGLKPSSTLLRLNGQRVRLVGFMAQMEAPPLGAFYLCPRPISCDEEGAGTADLPAESVLVIVGSQRGKVVSFSPRALEVTGVLEVGNRQDSDGQMSFIRLVLDGPEDLPVAGRPSTKN